MNSKVKFIDGNNLSVGRKGSIIIQQKDNICSFCFSNEEQPFESWLVTRERALNENDERHMIVINMRERKILKAL